MASLGGYGGYDDLGGGNNAAGEGGSLYPSYPAFGPGPASGHSGYSSFSLGSSPPPLTSGVTAANSTATELSRKVTPDGPSNPSPGLGSRPPPSSALGSVPSSTWLLPGTTSGGISVLSTSPTTGVIERSGTSGCSVTGLGTTGSFTGETPLLLNGSGGSTSLYPGMQSYGGLSAAASLGGRSSALSQAPPPPTAGLTHDGTAGAQSIATIPSLGRQTTTMGTAGTVDSGVFSAGGNSAYPDLSHHLPPATSSTTSGTVPQAPGLGAQVTAGSSDVHSSTVGFHGTLCVNSDLVDDEAEVLYAGFSNQMAAARSGLYPAAALAHSTSMSSSGYGPAAETSASLEARQIAAAMALSLQTAGVAAGSGGCGASSAASSLTLRQQSSAASAIADALSAYARASSLTSCPSGGGKMPALPSADAMRNVSASSAATMSSVEDDLATAALSEYRRKESLGQEHQDHCQPCENIEPSPLLGPACAAQGPKKFPKIAEKAELMKAEAAMAQQTEPVRTVPSGPLKKRLKMSGVNATMEENKEQGEEEREDEVVAVVDCVPPLPTFHHRRDAHGAGDDSSVSTTESSLRPELANNPTPTSAEEGEFVLSCKPILLFSPNDRQWLSDLLCFVRSQIEVFTATPDDVAARSRRGGMKQPIVVGRVGIRCRHCCHVPADRRAKGAVSYPNSIRIVHQSVRNWQRYHFKACSHIPPETKEMFHSFKTTRCHSGNASLRYWVESCERLGMVDTDPENGIRLRRRAPSPVPTIEDGKEEESIISEVPSSMIRKHQAESHDDETAASHEEDMSVLSGGREKSVTSVVHPLPSSLLSPRDETLITPFLHLILSQQQPTRYTSVDRLGKRRYRPIDFPGVECRHCSSRVASSGRYFPLTATTFANNNNPHNCVHSHLLKCRQCPAKVREALGELGAAHAADGERLPSGWKKRFFDRVWGRLHGGKEMNMPEEARHEEDVGAAVAALSELSVLSGMKRTIAEC